MEPSGASLLAAAVAAIRLVRSGWDAALAAKGHWQRPVSEEQYRYFRAAQKRERRHYAILAHRLSMNSPGRGVFMHAPLLAEPSWLVKNPIPLPPPPESLVDDGDRFVTTYAKETDRKLLSGPHQPVSVTSRKQAILPALSDQRAYRPELHRVIEALEQPPAHLFINRPSYALSRVRAGDKFEMFFDKAHYFDYIDCGELLAYELVRESALLEDRGGTLDDLNFLKKVESRLALRRSLGNWTEIQLRPSLAGVNILTIFVDRERKTATFPMMQRSAKTGSASSTVHVIPAGEFQPTKETDTSWDNHCTLWQTALREFAEEILLDDEAKSHGQEMTALARRPQIALQLQLIRSGH